MSGVTELGFALVAGSLTTLNPCVFPLLPLVLGGAVQDNRWAPVMMGLGMVSSFALLGLVVGVAGEALGIDPDHVRLAGAWLLVFFGLTLLVPWLNERFTRWMTPLATGANRATGRLNASSWHGAFGLGALLGMVWSPCSGPMLASALALVAAEGGAVRGVSILGVFGLGAALVLVAVAYASRASFGQVRTWVLNHMERTKKVFGVTVMFLGVAILLGGDKWLEAQVIDCLPSAWIDLTTRF